jgi:hypothetical protein
VSDDCTKKIKRVEIGKKFKLTQSMRIIHSGFGEDRG